MGVGGAAQVVVEEAVALHRYRSRGDAAAGRPGERQPGALGAEDAVEVRAVEEVALGGFGPAHRLLVGGEETGAVEGRAGGTGHDLDLVARPPVLVDPVAVAGAALAGQRRVGHLDEVAVAGTGQRRLAQGVADEDADQAGGGEVDRRRVEAARSWGRIAGGGAAGGRDEARVAVGGDRVARGAAVDRPDDQRRDELAVVELDPQRVRDPFGGEEAGRAEELLTARGLAAVGQEAGGGAHASRSAAAARNSSGSTPQTSQSLLSPSRRRWPRIVPSCRQPRLVTTRLAASL